VTRHPITVLEDGTRVYAGGRRYKPKPPEERAYRVRKPATPGAVRYNGSWFLPLALLPDGIRPIIETRPDTDAYDHMPKPCRCAVCRRPAAERWRRKWRRDHGLQP
jgi:hypothetical protein